MTKIREFLQGKKTYISAAALALVAILGWWFGYIDATTASGMLATAGIGAGLGAKSNRVAQDVLVALGNVRDAQGAAQRSGKPMDAKALAEQVAKQLAPEVVKAVASGAAQLPPQNIVSFPAGSMPVLDATPGSGIPIQVGAPQPATACIYCGALMSLVGVTGSVCTDPKNTSQPDSTGQRHHVFYVSVSGASAK